MPLLQAMFLSLLYLVFSCLPSPGHAGTTPPLTIGVISFDSQFLDAQRGLADGLSHQGFLQNKEIHYIIHDLKKDLSRVPGIVRELQQQHCNLILTTTTPVILAVKKSQRKTNPIPVVFTMVADPVGAKIVPSLQNPGGHITGISYNAFAMIPKRLELFRRAFPQLTKIAILYNHREGWIADPVRHFLLPAAKSLKFEVTHYDVHNQASMTTVSKQLDSTIEGLFMVPDPLAISFFGDLVKLSRKEKLPIMVLDNILLEKGGVLGYSPSFYSIGLQAAVMVSRILAGTVPGKLSIQNPQETKLIVSLKEAERLGLTLPDSFLANSDEIIRTQ